MSFFSKKKKAGEHVPAVDWLVVGLGNPGDEYAQTRHNLGWMTVDVLVERLNARYWKTECGAVTARVTVDGSQVMLAKPQTFMNLSGNAVAKLADAYGVAPDHIVVIADELDLEPGDIRTKIGGGHAGHNGHRSIIEKLQTRDYRRIRIGIGRPPGRMDPADYVLQPLRADAIADLHQWADAAASVAQGILGTAVDADLPV
ncbi:MAG: aminoacyl-tRNA hydrolase [Actinomycetes bacterium]|jgi:PTH1 family peptidyl-tRNA hydrolase|nr:aminoacyl-tRNA hydrolase [Actinomycetes bacterium]